MDASLAYFKKLEDDNPSLWQAPKSPPIPRTMPPPTSAQTRTTRSEVVQAGSVATGSDVAERGAGMEEKDLDDMPPTRPSRGSMSALTHKLMKGGLLKQDSVHEETEGQRLQFRQLAQMSFVATHWRFLAGWKSVSGDGSLGKEHEQMMTSLPGFKFVELAEKGFKEDDVLLVIDMQNDFLPEEDAKAGGRFGVSEGGLASRGVVRLIKAAARANISIVASRDYHPHNHCSFLAQNGPFPPHCVQGHEGSHFFAAVGAALTQAREAQKNRVHVVFKGFQNQVDSFGAFPYDDEFFAARGLMGPGSEPQTLTKHGLCALDWTGGFVLEQSNLDQDINAPPDVMAVFTRRPLKQVAVGKRLFVCGLALDYCVLDSAINAANSGGFAEVFIVYDATRAAHIPGLGSFGSGFLTDPEWILHRTLGKVKFVTAKELLPQDLMPLS